MDRSWIRAFKIHYRGVNGVLVSMVLYVLISAALGMRIRVWSLTPDAITGYGDFKLYFVPLWSTWRESILAGNFPWWDDSQNLGFFFAGNPQCNVFYLPNYLLLLPEPWGYEAYALFPMALFGWGLWKSTFRKWNPVIGMLVSLCIAHSLWFLGLHSMPTASHTISWIPILWLICEKGKLRTPGLLAFVVSQGFLAGCWDVWIFPVMGSLILYRMTLRIYWKYVLREFLLTTLLCLPQVLLTFHYLPETAHVGIRDVHALLKWSVDWSHLLSFLSASSTISPSGIAGWTLFFGKRAGWMVSGFIGIPFLLLLPLTFRRVFRDPLLLVWMMACTTAAIIGNFGWFQNWLESLHVGFPIRYPDKLLVSVVLVLVHLWGTYSVDDAILLGKKYRYRLCLWGVAWMTALVWIGLVLLDQWVQSIYGSTKSTPADFRIYLDIYNNSVHLDLLTLWGVGVLLCLLFSVQRIERFVPLFIGAAMLVDVLLNSGKIGSLSEFIHLPHDGIPTKAPTRFLFLSEAAPYEKGRGSIPVRWVDPKKGDPDVYALGGMPDLGVRNGFANLSGTDVFPIYRSQDFVVLFMLLDNSSRREIAYRTGLNGIVGLQQSIRGFRGIIDTCLVDPRGAGYCKVGDSGQSSSHSLVRFHPNQLCFPGDSSAMMNMLLHPDRSAVYMVGKCSEPRKPPSIRNVQILRWTSSQKVVKVGPGTDGWVVLSQSYFADWKVRVNGQPQPLLRVDHSMQGVKVGKDPCTITFELDVRRWVFLYWTCGLLFGLLLIGFNLPRWRSGKH